MQRKPLIIIFVVVHAILTSCGGGNAGAAPEGERIPMEYADLLTLSQCDGYVYAQIRNPWDTTTVLHSYILIARDTPLPGSLPKGDVVRTPLRASVVYTLVHTALIDELGAYDQIRGVCDRRYITIDKLQADCRKGRIRDLGEGLNPDIEGIIDLAPDAILLSPFQNAGGYGRLGKLGIPIIECADYMETSAMGRAEWIKFYGLLYGREEQAQAIFDSVAHNYGQLRQLAHTAHTRPTVVTDLKYGSTWYVPGGNSTTGRLLADAAADYIYRETTDCGSLALDPETVFDRAIDADIWIIRYNQATDKTYSELAAEYANYTQMQAFRRHNVYACNTEQVPFYREAPFHPDLLLRDFIKILHPELLPHHRLRYYKRMEK